MTVRPIFAWYDLWVGVYIDRPRHRLYVLPLPMLGFVVEWSRLCTRCHVSRHRKIS